VPDRLRQVLDSLRKEQSILESQLGKVRDAIVALGGASTRREQTKRARPVARKRRGMTATQKAAVSKRMKAYWAARKAKKGR
jgi:hypothetical protein